VSFEKTREGRREAERNRRENEDFIADGAVENEGNVCGECGTWTYFWRKVYLLYISAMEGFSYFPILRASISLSALCHESESASCSYIISFKSSIFSVWGNLCHFGEYPPCGHVSAATEAQNSSP